MVVLHYTGMRSASAARERLCDAASQVSSHYLITETGVVEALVPETLRAWHAGVSRWGATHDVNSASVGVEIVNPGHEWGYRPFPERQIAALEALLQGVMARWNIPPERIVGHSDVAPARKDDPGERFDWRRLARAGLSIWPGAADIRDDGAALDAGGVRDFMDAASRFGYPVDAGSDAILRAFRRRFRPHAMKGAPCEADLRIARALAKGWPSSP